MNTLKLKLFIGIFTFALLLPSTSLAYLSTDQTATRLNTNTILYTVTFFFGFDSRELYMPIGVLRDDGATTSSPYLKYSILNNKDTPTDIGSGASLVFSSSKDVQIRDNQYYLPKGKAAKFTLVTLLTIPKEQQTADLDLSLLVTSLPFTMVQDGTPIPAHLNPSELQYYRSPAVKLLGNGTVMGAIHTLTTK